MTRGIFNRLLGGVIIIAMAWPCTALAQSSIMDRVLPTTDAAVSGRIIQLVAAITVLSVAPGLLMMVTCFARFTIAFSFLRSGLGLQTTPSNLILISLALFMTMFVMAPTFDSAWQKGIKPLLENKITEADAYSRTAEPFREFMLANVRDKDLKSLEALAEGRFRGSAKITGETDFRVLIPAFMISELRRGFEIGFLIVLPFLVIDIIVASVVMSMGMMMLPPTVIALPLKILFFVLIDGWTLVVSGLIRSFA
jgi:flagellar biosynthesis protein FliP